MYSHYLRSYYRISARIVIALLAACLLVVAMTGCGGGASSSLAQARGTGRATFVFEWPSAKSAGASSSRLLPPNTQSYGILIYDPLNPVKDGNGNLVPLRNQPVSQPANGSSATVSFDGLPIGTLTAVVSAYNTTITNALTPGAVATATVNTSFQTQESAATTQPITFTLASTIKSISVSSATLTAGTSPIMLGYSPLDGNGNIVLAGGTISVSSDNPAVVSVKDPTQPVITPASAGQANVTVTYTITDQNKNSAQFSGSAVITVLPAPTVTPTGPPPTNLAGVAQLTIAGGSNGLPTGIQAVTIQVDSITPPMTSAWPVGQTSAQVYVNNLTPGTHTLTVQAQSNSSGAGVALGSGTASVQIVAGQVAAVSVALSNAVSATAIGLVDATGKAITPSTLVTGQTGVNLQIIGTTAGHTVIPLAPSAFIITTQIQPDASNLLLNTTTASVTVDPNSGAVTLLNQTAKAIQATITVTDRYTTSRSQVLPIAVAANDSSVTLNIH